MHMSKSHDPMHVNSACPSTPCDRDADRTEHADYVVVGLGTAGAPLVRYLANAGYSVHVIECGGDTRNDPLVRSPEVAILDSSPQYHSYYPASRGQLAPNGPLVPTLYNMGCMWGGSSGHNYTTAVYGTPGLYDEWAELACDRSWRFRDLRPIMIGAETYTPLNGYLNAEARGVCGPLSTTQRNEQLAPTDPFVQATSAVGAPFSLDYNDPTRGVFVTGAEQAYNTLNPRERSWTATAYLGEDVVRRLPNGDGEGLCDLDIFIASSSTAIRVLFDDEVGRFPLAATEVRLDPPHEHELRRRSIEFGGGGDPSLTARGVRYVRADGTVIDAIAHVKVILAAGAVEDPAILQRSGIGPCDVLDRLGVEPRVVNDNVGRGGQNHFGVVGFFPALPGQAPAVVETFFRGEESTDDGRREFQIIWIVNDPSIVFSSFFPPNSVIGFAALLRPARNVEVDAQSCDPADRPFIRFNYLEEERDRRQLVELAKIIGRTSIHYRGELPTNPPATVFPNDAEFGPYGGVGSNETLYEWARTNGLELTHISGTARMGCSACDGVVDGNLDVFGVDNLGVVSNSVVPQILDGNTAWSALITGIEKARIEGVDVPEGNACEDECHHTSSDCHSCDDHHDSSDHGH